MSDFSKAHNSHPLSSIRLVSNSQVWRGIPHLIRSHGISNVRRPHPSFLRVFYEAQGHHN